MDLILFPFSILIKRRNCVFGGNDMTLAELRKEPHLSSSSINDYVECGLLYKLGRIDHIPMEFRSDSLEFGSAVHLVLADFYQEKMAGNNLLLKDIHALFEHYWGRWEGSPEIAYSKGKDFETLLMEGKELLSTWYDKLPEDSFTVLSIEEPFSFSIPSIPLPIIGATDLIEEDEDGTIIITDWKTSGRSYSNDEVDNSMQLTVYQMSAKANGFKGRNILLKIDCLIKTKKPDFKQYWTTRSEMDEKRVIKKITACWEGIEKGVFIPNDTSWRCKNCPFKTACNDWFEKGGAL
jgi:putative RecB family exonuclease